MTRSAPSSQAGGPLTHLLRRAVEGQDINPQPQRLSILPAQLHAPALSLPDPSYSGLVQGRQSVGHAGGAKVVGVVVAHGHPLDPAQGQRLGILGPAAEGILGRGLQPPVGKAALQVGKGQIVFPEDLRHLGKGVVQRISHHRLKVVRIVTGGEGAIPQQGDPERPGPLGLRRPRHLRVRWVRRRMLRFRSIRGLRRFLPCGPGQENPRRQRLHR